MQETIPKHRPRPFKRHDDEAESAIPDFAAFVAQDKAREAASKRAAAAADNPPPQKREEDIGEKIRRMVEENRPKHKAVTAKQYQQATKFQVGSEIDEAGLSAIEFRIYAHLVRRADKDGQCFPSITDICHYCQCERKTAVKAIEVLVVRRFIACQKRFHKPTLYKLREARDWCKLTVE